MADKAKVFGFKVIAFDPYLTAEAFVANAVDKADFETLLSSSDIISLHCPLVPETTQLINADVIGRMKPGVILVNTSRGPVVKEDDLIAALKSGKIKGAGLDVFEREPLPAGSPLRSFENVILTSHAASVSERAADLLQIKAAEAARDFLLGKRPASVLV